jgi:hypothetical protein
MKSHRLWVLGVTVIVGMPTVGTALAGEVETRRVNNEMVVLEAVPEVPERIVDQLNRYQNTRGASFQIVVMFLREHLVGEDPPRASWAGQPPPPPKEAERR